jgi:hypothetical protein
MTTYFVSSASGAGGAGNGSSWANAYLTIAAALSGGRAGGDIIFVGDDHAENTTGAQNWFFNTSATNPGYIYVVDHTKSSPTAADLKVGTLGAGSVQNDGAITFNMYGYVYGLYMESGVGASTALSPQGGSSRVLVLDHCTIKNSSTGASARTYIPPSSGYSLHKDCTFIATHSTMQMTGNWYGKMLNCTFLFPNGSATPLFTGGGMGNTFVTFEGCDFSAYGGTKIFDNANNGGTNITFKDCKLPSTASLFTLANDLRPEQSTIWVLNCDSGTTNYKTDVYHYAGELHAAIDVVRTGGASQGTAYSWKTTTNANNGWNAPLQLMPISIWNATTGAAVNVTIEGIADTRDFFQLPNNDEVWFDVEALENASLPQGTYHVGTKTTPLGTNSALTASTAAWDCANTRANSTAYNLGDIIKVASNPGRLFMCTGLTTGITASSEPGGYATAVDGGGGVTDGGCVFKAMWRFKQTITTGTIGMAGLITVYPKVAKASLNGIYIDPLAMLT